MKTDFMVKIKELTARVTALTAQAAQVDVDRHSRQVIRCGKTQVVLSPDGMAIEIDTHRGAEITTRCWHEGRTRMIETWRVGSDEMATLIRKMDELESAITELERD